MVETLTPESFDIFVQKIALLTLNIPGTTKLFFLISILLKTTPVFGLAGINLIWTFFPECKPTPLNSIDDLIVF